MSIQLTLIDLTIIAVYAVFIIALGLILARKHKNAEDYLWTMGSLICRLLKITGIVYHGIPRYDGASLVSRFTSARFGLSHAVI